MNRLLIKFTDSLTRIQRFYPLLVQMVVYAYAISHAAHIHADPDLWGHLKFGEEIITLGKIPEFDTYSYTAYGHPWINHEWFSEVLFYLIYKYMGSTGLLLFKTALIVFIVFLMTRMTLNREGLDVPAPERRPAEKKISKPRKKPKKSKKDKKAESTGVSLPTVYLIYLLYFMLAISVISLSFPTRPQLMTFLCLTLMLYALQEFFSGRSRALTWVPLIFLVWVNSHGGVVAGLGMLGVVTVIEGGRAWIGEEDHWRPLALCFGLSCLVVLVNPYGYKLWLFFFQSLTLERGISEWEPVAIWSMRFLGFKLLALLVVITFFAPTRKRWWEVAIILVSLVFAFKHLRHIPLAVIVMTPYLPRQWMRLASSFKVMKFNFRFSPAFHLATQFILVLYIGFLLHNAHFKYSSNNYKIMVWPTNYPSYLVRFMKNNRIHGNLLVPFGWGEYFIWKLPESKVSNDGRFRTIYPLRISYLHGKFYRGDPGWEEILKEYPTDLIVTRNFLTGTDWTYNLGATEQRKAQQKKLLEDWVILYRDFWSTLYARKTVPPSPWLKKYYDHQLIRASEMISYEFP